jgi:hypothetical protein
VFWAVREDEAALEVARRVLARVVGAAGGS